MTADGPAERFFELLRAKLEEVRDAESESLSRAARLTADRLMAGGILHVFGTGHSHMLAEEIFVRAGGLPQVNAILDPGLMLHLSAVGSTTLERLEGYVPIVLERYDLRPRDVLLVVSNSGRNAGPIDAAIYAKERQLLVVALTSAAEYRDKPVRHTLGKHLSRIADVVIDTHVPAGDAVLEMPDLPGRIGPISTIVAATLVQMLIVEIVGCMVARGHRPEVLMSANIDGGADPRSVLEAYGSRIRHR